MGLFAVPVAVAEVVGAVVDAELGGEVEADGGVGEGAQEVVFERVGGGARADGVDEDVDVGEGVGEVEVVVAAHCELNLGGEDGDWEGGLRVAAGEEDDLGEVRDEGAGDEGSDDPLADGACCAGDGDDGFLRTAHFFFFLFQIVG